MLDYSPASTTHCSSSFIPFHFAWLALKYTILHFYCVLVFIEFVSTPLQTGSYCFDQVLYETVVTTVIMLNNSLFMSTLTAAYEKIHTPPLRVRARRVKCMQRVGPHWVRSKLGALVHGMIFLALRSECDSNGSIRQYRTSASQIIFSHWELWIGFIVYYWIYSAVLL